MIKADAKTGIIAKMGDNIVLLSDVAMLATYNECILYLEKLAGEKHDN